MWQGYCFTQLSYSINIELSVCLLYMVQLVAATAQNAQKYFLKDRCSVLKSTILSNEYVLVLYVEFCLF